MKRKAVKILVITLVLLSINVLGYGQNDTLRISSYNLLNFDSDTGEERLGYFRTVIDSMGPDILACQEVSSESGAQYFLENVLDTLVWSRSSFSGVGYSDVVLFYKNEVAELQEQYSVQTELRNVEIFDLVVDCGRTMERLLVASTHLKASTGDVNENRRRLEVNSFLNYLTANTGVPTQRMLFCGDFNFYSADESGYELLMDDGRFVDPINQSGNWHNNSQFADIHTQSPRTTSFGEGAHGGMDDRFDFILMSPAFSDGQQWEYVENSYMAYGNDGNHFNMAINDGTNSAVSQVVANAIHYASDHLPVSMDITFSTGSNVETTDTFIPDEYVIHEVYPNPFNSNVNVLLNLPVSTDMRVDIFNIHGQRVATLHEGVLDRGINRLSYQAEGIPSGIYFLSVNTSSGHKELRKIAFIK